MININYNGKNEQMNIKTNSNKTLYSYERSNSYFFQQ